MTPGKPRADTASDDGALGDVRMTARTLQILLALAEGARHGYGIKLAVAERSGGRVRLRAGTLYEAIQRLHACGWIDEVEPPADAEAAAGPPRRFYALTPAGSTALRDELRHLRDIVSYAEANALLSG